MWMLRINQGHEIDDVPPFDPEVSGPELKHQSVANPCNTKTTTCEKNSVIKHLIGFSSVYVLSGLSLLTLVHQQSGRECCGHRETTSPARPAVVK
jgi:hypothetical protein